MNLIALETSSQLGSVALAHIVGNHPTLLGGETWQRGFSHSELLTLSMQNIFLKCDRSLNDLEAVAVGIGPGSFTGVRVALNCARAISYSKNIPIYFADSLRVLLEAARLHESAPLLSGKVLCVVNAFRGLLYVALFDTTPDKVTVTWQPQALSPEQVVERLPIGPIYLLGDAGASFAASCRPEVASQLKMFTDLSPNAISLAHLVARGDLAPPTLDWRAVIPLYIRGSEAEEKLRGGALKPLRQF